MSSTSSPSSQMQGATPSAGIADAEKSTTPDMSNDGRSRDSTVPAACLACRSKHLKCDGHTPCTRCVNTQNECVYVASRRGYKGPRRGTVQNPNKRQATSPPDLSPSSSDCPMLLGARTGSTNMPAVMGGTFGQPSMPPQDSQAAQFSHPQQPTNMQLYKSYCAVNGIVPSPWTVSQNGGRPVAQIPIATVEGRCFDSFYHHFHASHPFVLPKPFLLQISKEAPLKPVLAAIRWVGSIFIDVGGPIQERLFDEAYSLIHSHERSKDGFLVQAMMLLIVGLDGGCQQDKARRILSDVEALALELGLNTREFAANHGRGIPVLEESWRRTWWDLFVIDGMVAGVHRVTNFLLFDVSARAALPCEEDEYLSARIPIPLYLDDLEDQDFSGEDREFSSFAYRVLCARNLGKLMRVPPMFGPEDENLGKIETLLTNWRLHLPQSKRDALQKNGKLDEMMFQAHMMNQATSIMLHQPYSQLDSSPTQDINSCAPHQSIPAGDLFNAHTRHTIESANRISTMITHRVPLLSHTHFFTCVITLSSIVHLSRWALFFIPHDDDDLRQQIRLNIGALNHLSDVWSAADRARGQVKAVAQEIYKVKKQQRSNSQFWLGLSQEDMLNTIATDDSIINEIESFEPIPHLLR
ncbi:glucoamylase [Metarhizium rileyi]|uniref:Glucoamylase n=1 Tax=Metarhizium rileyi (strain RCEF 4871) TaxID=1649241 RepID=A0A162J2M6_METRR|nr:glucoamylase [Metarhizium rileyi RCEF 4871]